MFMLLLHRLIFLILFYENFDEVPRSAYVNAFLVGTLTDAIAIIYFLLPMWLLLMFAKTNSKSVRTIALSFFVLGFFTACILNVADFGYYPITKKRMGAELINMLPEIPSLMGAYLADYWYLLVLLIAFLVVSFFIIRSQLRKGFILETELKFKAANILVIAFCFITIMRGGYGKRPFTPFDIPNFADPRLQWLACNTPFQFLHTLNDHTVKKETFFSEEEAEKIIAFSKESKKIEFKKKNILFIILESFCCERIGYYNPKVKAYTPFLDSLFLHSRTYSYGMANGRMTIDALPSVLSGIPSFMDKNYCYSSYSTNKVIGLSGLLKQSGYSTCFYYGGLKNTFGFQNYIHLNFSSDYLSQEDFSASYENSGWGVDDHLFLPFVASHLNKLKEPFCASLLTLSLHHPFPIPEPYKTSLDSIKDPVKKSMKYTDLALRSFFSAISNQSWYKNSVIAICADHTSDGLGDFENNRLNEFGIPIVFIAPGDSVFNQPQEFSISQIDMYPTILDYIGFNTTYGCLGSSALNSSVPSVQYCGNGLYSLFEFPFLLEFDVTAQKVKSIKRMGTNRKIIEVDEKNNEKIKQLENKVKAYIQVFSNRVNSNTL